MLLSYKSKGKRLLRSTSEEDVKEEGPSLWQMLIEGIVRPPRYRYDEGQLGEKMLKYRDKFYMRNEYSVPHSRLENKTISMSLFATGEYSSHVILYLHGNASSRLEALQLIKYMPKDLSLACFDFMGCGENQHEDTVTLGYREAEQVDSVVKYLQSLGYRTILWGRSMGAATALLYGKADVIVADSTFKCFRSLCKDVAKKHKPKMVPGCMINCLFPCVYEKLRMDVSKRADYDTQALNVTSAVKKLHAETLTIFMTGEEDELIDASNSKALYELCPCKEKHLKTFEGTHNSCRPYLVMLEVMDLVMGKVRKSKN